MDIIFYRIVVLATIVGYFSLVVAVAYFSAGPIKRPGLRWTSRCLIFSLLIAAPFADEIVGRIYFKHLCKTEAGLHVYKTVELGPEYYHEDGSPKFMDSKGRFDSTVFDGRYVFKTFSIENYAKFVRIKKRRYLVIDSVAGTILGAHINFFYFGGWLVNSLGAHVRGIHCGSVNGGFYEGIIRHILVPVT